MTELMGSVIVFAVLIVYLLLTPFFAFAAWRRTGRIAELERRLRDAERRLMMPRGVTYAMPEPDGEPAGQNLAHESSAHGRGVGAAAAVAAEPVVSAKVLSPPAAPREPDWEAYPGFTMVEERAVPEERRSSRRQAIGDAWEAGVEGGVLANVGAVLVVIGVGLFVGWSMMHLAPIGRVAVAVAVSGGLLAAGLVFQRWPDYRSVALGLSAAGWGGLYVTAYAMHGLDAARVIDDPFTAFGLLMAVAAGMIVHALWVDMPAMVAAAYAAAFAAVAICPASIFAAVACVTLAATLLAVAAWYNWMAFAVVGIVCTYGILEFRPPPSDVVFFGGLTVAQAMVWACWLLFEVFDILMAARGRSRFGPFESVGSVMPLNLCGLLGASMLLWPSTMEGLDAFCAAAAVAYAASAVFRVLIARRMPVAPVDGTGLSGYEATITVATVFWAIAIGLKYTAGWRLHVGLLMEAEVLFLTGLLFGERYLRALAAGVFTVAVLRFLAFDLSAGGEIVVRGITLTSWTPSALLAAAVFAINRAILGRTDQWPLLVSERLFSYAATALATLVIGGEVLSRHNGLAPEMLGVAWLLLAWVLLQIAVRLKFLDAYRQSEVIAFLALVPLVVVNALPIVPFAGDVIPFEVWIWLLPAVVILHALIWQARADEWLSGVDPQGAVVTSLGLMAVNGLTLVLLWHALPAPLVALGWAAFAVIVFRFGLWLPEAGLRGHAYVILALAVGRLFLANFTNAGMTGFVSHRMLTVVPLILVLYDFAGRLADRQLRPRVDVGERLIGASCCWAGTAVIVVLMRFEFGRTLAVVGWAALGFVLLMMGRRRATAHLRWQSHAIALLTFARSWGTQFYVPEAPGGFFQPWVLGGIVVAILFASELLAPPVRSHRRPLLGIAHLLGWLDAHRRSYYAVLGTVLLAALLVHEVPAKLLTAALGVEGAALLVLGFARPDLDLRMCGLAVLGICVPKLFFWDLRHLETPYRILSFLFLGILLIAASWFYARFKDRLRSIP